MPPGWAAWTNRTARQMLLEARALHTLLAVALLSSALPASGISITGQPTNQTAVLGGTASFKVTTSDPGLVYMWFLNGVGLPGENGDTLTIFNVRPENVGVYFAQIISRAGQVVAQTDMATLTIPSPNLVITAQPENQKIFLGGTADFFVHAASSQPLQYQWLYSGKLIPGATNDHLTLGGIMEAQLGSYRVKVSSASAAVLSEPADLVTTIERPPVISMPPLNQGALPGETVRFEVTATGSATLIYTWRHDGAPIPGATNPMLVLNNVQPADAGTYWVTVSTASGISVTASAVLNVYWLAMSAPADISLQQGAVSAPIPITLFGDSETVASATLNVASSNSDLASGDNVFFSGAGAERMMLIMSRLGASGTAQVTVTASGNGQMASTQFNLTVIGGNTPPVISNLPERASLVLGHSLSIPFAVADQESSDNVLQVQARLVGSGPLLGAQVTSAGGSRVLVVMAGSAQIGSQSVVVSVVDGGGKQAEATTTLTVVGPRLDVAVQGAELVVSSADAPEGGQVEFCTALTGGTWRPLGYAPVAENGVRVVRIPVPASAVFFRLKY